VILENIKMNDLSQCVSKPSITLVLKLKVNISVLGHTETPWKLF